MLFKVLEVEASPWRAVYGFHVDRLGGRFNSAV